MSRLVSRAHQWRLTRWIQTQNRGPIWSPSTRFSGISDSKTRRKGLYEDSIKKREKREKHEMVKKLATHVEILTCRSNSDGGVCDVYLIGTNHYLSQKSSKEVQEIIKFLKPEVVFLGLCSTPKNMPTEEEIISELEKQANFKATSRECAEFCSRLRFIAESELRVAYEEAMKYDCRVVLGDRPIAITRQRFWRKLSLWEKIKLLSSVLWCISSQICSKDTSKLTNQRIDINTLTRIQDIANKFPSLSETFVHERDQYMSLTLAKVASQSSLVVAVVGKGHLPGMKKHWKQPIVLKDLITIPPPKAFSLAYVLAGVATISGIYLSFKT